MNFLYATQHASGWGYYALDGTADSDDDDAVAGLMSHDGRLIEWLYDEPAEPGDRITLELRFQDDPEATDQCTKLSVYKNNGYLGVMADDIPPGPLCWMMEAWRGGADFRPVSSQFRAAGANFEF